MAAMHPTVTLTRDLVRIPSENPASTESGVSDFVHRWCAALPAVEVERQQVQPGRDNVVARLRSGASAPAFVMLAHMDTVPVGDGWTHDPFGGEIVDGRLYGRGSCDMKSGLAVAMAVLAGAARQGRKPSRDIVVCATVDEEGSQMLGGNDLISRGVVQRDSLIVATEPSDLQVVVAHKGLVWMEVKTTGKLAHAGNPHVGIDAVRVAAEFVTRFHRVIAKLPYTHEMLGPATVTFSHASGGIKTNVVPEHARLELDIRLPPPMSIAEVHTLVGRCAREVESEIPGCRIAFAQFNNERPPVEADRASDIVRVMTEAAQAVTGRSDVVAGFPAYTDASVVQARTGNRSAVVFGPGRLAQAHTVDEYVPVDHIEKAEAHPDSHRRPALLRMSASPKILVHSPRHGEAQRYADLIRAQFPDARIAQSTNGEDAQREAADAEILVGWFFPRSVFAQAPQLRWVHKVSAGVEDVAFHADLRPDVVLTRTDGAMIAPRMIEYVLGAIFAIVQQFPRAWRQQRERHWQSFPVGIARGSTVGIAGMGDIGTAIAQAVQRNGMRVVGWRRSNIAADAVERLYVGNAELESFAAACDFLVIVLPATAETKGIFGSDAFAAMKRSAWLINVGRGAVVDETALAQALGAGQIAGAVLDVYARGAVATGEPPLGAGQRADDAARFRSDRPGGRRRLLSRQLSALPARRAAAASHRSQSRLLGRRRAARGRSP